MEEFFTNWVAITKPLHNLRPRTQEVLVAFLMERYRLQQEIKDVNALNRLLLNDYETRVKVRNTCNMKTTQQVTNTISEMAEAGVCRKEPMEGMDNRYNYILEPKFIPDLIGSEFSIKFALKIK